MDNIMENSTFNLPSSNDKEGKSHMPSNRTKVKIRCKVCGEHYILKGRREKGKVHTGFRQCVCDNAHDFEIEYDDY